VLGQLQRLPEALASYDRAIAIDPTDALAHCNRGALLNAMGRKDAALADFDRTIALHAGFPAAHFGRAALLQERRQWLTALASYDQVIALSPVDVAAHYNRGTVLRQLERWGDALASFDRVLALDDKMAAAHVGRAEALYQLDRAQHALDSYNRAIGLAPNAAAYSGRGVVQQKMGDFAAALASFDQAIASQPEDPQGYFNRGAALEKLGDFARALDNYRRAVSLKPDFAAAHLNLALTALKVGDYPTGWAHYEWRWQVQRGPILIEARDLGRPLWRGTDDIAGRTILLHGEQGLGDMLQFCRYAEQVAARGAKVILEVARPLVSVCATLRGVTQVIARGEILPAFDVQCPLMSLPLACKTTVQSIPVAIPYLRSDPDKVAVWRERLGAKTKPRIGLTWSGSVGARTFSERSFALAQLIPHLPDDFQYFCLQTEITDADRGTLLENSALRRFEGELRDFSDTAALCACLDLVITMDTSLTHLVGALGRPAWVLLPFDGDWRWLKDREDSPWYPTVRVFRQKSRGDWAGVFAEVAGQLGALSG
jgi:tetratricopeptide (TPR) repeat protein